MFIVLGSEQFGYSKILDSIAKKISLNIKFIFYELVQWEGKNFSKRNSIDRVFLILRDILKINYRINNFKVFSIFH